MTNPAANVPLAGSVRSRLLEKLEKITKGQGELKDLDELEELCNYIKTNSLCGLGQTAPNPVLATLRYFRDEYVAHIVDKKCPAGVCKALLNYHIIADKMPWLYGSAHGNVRSARSAARSNSHTSSITAKCIKCGACMETCKFGAIEKA